MASSTMEKAKLPGGYLVTPRVPQGLAAAVEGLTREVIRHSPEDIYVFAAHHFEKLLLLREQCGAEEMAMNRDDNLRNLREMSQALRVRDVDRGNTRTMRYDSDQVGWSLNQTAKVLKRHRSIFGDTGRRISTDEVFQMANQKDKRSRSSKLSAERDGSRANAQRKEGSRPSHQLSNQTTEDLWKASTSKTERSWSNEDSLEVASETRSGPRIITQIPSLQSSTGLLAKDIKTELRKNRISSRERRNVRAKPEDRSAIDGFEIKSGGKISGKHVSARKSSEKQKRMETEVEKRNRRSVDSTRSFKERQNSQESPKSRDLNTDRVKDYVVQRFATTKSLEELQTLNYVEKVQEIIDETGPIIKGKVEELKSGMIGRSKRSSWFANDGNNRLGGSNGSESNNRSSGENSSHKNSTETPEASGATADALRTRLTETQHLLENVSSKMARPRRSRSARSSRRSVTTNNEIFSCKDSGEEATASTTEISNRENGLERRLNKTRNLLEDISSTLSRPMRRSSSAKSLRRHEENDDSSDFGGKDALKARLDETRNLLEGISATFAKHGHRVRSAKGRRSKASGNLVFEEISSSESQNTSKVSLPAVRSVSAKSSSGSVSRSDSDNLVLPAISPEAPKSKRIIENVVLPVLSPPGTGSSNEGSKIGEEIDVFAEEDIPEIPVEDYIPEAMAEDVFRDSLNVTPDFDSIPQRPDSLEPLETPEDIEASSKADNLEERLQEIQKVAKDIEGVFISKTSGNPQHSENMQDSVMKKKLQEIEEAEKRIERIFDSEVCKENKDSPESDTKADASVEAVDGSGESGRNVEAEVAIGRIAANGSKVKERKDEEEFKEEKQGTVKLSAAPPEPLNYTYVLTEGSPYEIPDSVTTVIIPERTVESPESDRLEAERENGMDTKLSLASGGPARKGAKEVEEIDGKVIEETDGKAIEDMDKDVKTTAVSDTKSEVSSQSDLKSPTDSNNTEKKSSSASPKNGNQSNEDDSSLKNEADPFGELVEPESIELPSSDVDFIRGIESRQEIHICHQDLSRINEEMSEELEGLEECDAVNKPPEKIKAMKVTKLEDIQEAAGSPDDLIIQNVKDDDEVKKVAVDDALELPETIEAVEETKEEVTGSPDGPMIQIEKQNDQVRKVEVNKLKSRTDSDLSPEASRPDLDSESSNEAKESSGPDELLESAKYDKSMEEDESSDTRSPESSNEVKETTLTDGLSLSLDPARPFVPELNLDSLQDITVSSFKLTEDDCDNQGLGESGNTNSITDTLTSDENHRIIENAEFAEEAVMEYLVSSSDGSKLEEAGIGQGKVVEEPIAKSQVEIKEDIYEKNSAYIMGRSNEQVRFPNVDRNLAEIELENRSEEKEKEDGKDDVMKRSTGDYKEEIHARIEEEDKGDKAERDSPTEHEQMENLAIEQEEHKKVSEEVRKVVEPESPVGQEMVEVATTEGQGNGSTEEKSDAKSANSEVKEEEEIKEDDSESSEAPAVEDSEGGSHRVEGQTKESTSGDLSGEIRSVEEGSDEILEENFVEEDTPLAVSRSASQCTTRRVSSGNLARLREDSSLGWTEETEQDIGNEEDGNSSKVKFSKIGGETIREQGSDELDQSQDSENPQSVSVSTNGNLTKDSREYHIYVPEVDASDDNSTTESSTVDSAVTKIQARVRGFLTRRRMHRGQHNRSSTLSSIPSIQDSIAEPYHIDDQRPEAEGHTNERTEDINISSPMALDDPGLENAATRIQSNYRGYKARKRLKREDAVQRTTLSLEKSFAETGLQHTGEFHDCIPLPIHDIALDEKNLSPSDKEFQPIPRQSASSPLATQEISSGIKNIVENFEKAHEGTHENLEGPQNLGKMFFGQSSNVPLIQFGMSPNIGEIVDLFVLAKEEAAVESGYLNFITSVEDAEAIEPNPGFSANGKEFSDGNGSNESLKEPLALSATRVGVIIEEVTSSDFERFLNPQSSESTTMAPEVSTESLGSARAPCVSCETISESMDGSKAEDIGLEAPIIQETPECRRSSSKDDENLVLPAESSIKDFGIPESFSLPLEKELLGPESSVDSMECPVVGSEDKSSSRSSGEGVETLEVRREVGGLSNEVKAPYEQRDSSPGSEVIKESPNDEEPFITNVDEGSSTLSFSMKVEDFLGLGSEDSIKLQGKKRILEVTLTSGDIVKSMSLSQESQLAGERIESPITMVQMAPARSESLQLEEPSESGCEEEESSRKPISPSSAKSEHTKSS